MIKYENSEPKAVGCVFAMGEHNYYNDSDFYAEYVDIENGIIGYEEYDTTRFAGGGYATIDLTFENLNKYWEKAKSIRIEQIKESLLFEAKQVTKGKRVIVNRGRKVPHGVEGEIFYLKKVNYDPYGRDWYTETKIGLKDDNDNVYWTYAKNVDVVNAENYILPESLNSRLRNGYDYLFNVALNLHKDEDKEELKKKFYKF